MALLHSSSASLIAQFIACAIYLCAYRLTVSTTDDLEALLVEAFYDAMHRAHLTLKEMAFAMGIDRAQLERQLRREKGQQLSVYRLLHAPTTWWIYFGPSLTFIVARKHWQELKEELARMTTDLRRLG